MIKARQVLSMTLSASLCLSALALAGCNRLKMQAAVPVEAPVAAPMAASVAAPVVAASTVAATQTASAPDTYSLPSASQLYEMVAPIALFPDKLLAQVLAGSAFPEQISAADQWLEQNPTLKGHALQSAVDLQAWDPSVKALTSFRSVLKQMAQNLQWTTALGTAYVNDPVDVMNAVQVMRQRASAKGALNSTAQQRVSTLAHASVQAPPPDVPIGQPGSVIVPPPQTIVIEPAQAGVVYVPVYNPAVVYGMPMPLYPGYIYMPPVYSPADMAATGLISFGLGVAVGATLNNHYNWGWNAWGVHWGNGYAGGWGAHGGAVVFHNTPYWSHSTTIVNHVNNIHVGPNYRPDFSHDVNRHIINSVPGHYSNWNDVHHQAALHPGIHPMTQPHFDQFTPTHQAQQRAAAVQSARTQNGVQSHSVNNRPDHINAAHPATPAVNSAAHRPEPSTGNWPGNRQHSDTGLGHGSVLATARTAPLTERGLDTGFSGGFGAWHGRGR